MNWSRIFLFAAVLGVLGALINLLGSLEGPSGLALAAVLVISLSVVVFVALGCLQEHRTWFHTLCVCILGYVLGDALSRLLVPKLRGPLDESLGELALLVIISTVAARAGVWLRRRTLRGASQS
jgi:hypothetical protein